MVFHQVFYVAVAPFVEEACVAVFAFGIFPHVETFGHYHHSQRVAYVHLHLRRHVVGRAYGVAAHCLHHLYLAYQRSLVYGGAERTKVVVQTYALELACLSVELESALLCHRGRAYAHVYSLPVNELAVAIQFCHEFVQIWRFGRPQLWLLHVEHSADVACPGHVAVAFGHDEALLVVQGYVHAHRSVIQVACNLGCHFHFGQFSVGLGGIGECLERLEPCLVFGHNERHGAVYAASGIPPAAFLNVVQVNLDSVVARLYIRCDVHLECVVAVGPVAGTPAVDAHGRFAHGPVKHQFGMFAAFRYAYRCLVVAFAYPWQRARAA